MKTDLKSITEDLRKLTDLKYIKTELNKVVADLKKIDLHVHLTPQAKSRLKVVEKRFNLLRGRLTGLQKQVDGEVNKFIKILKKTGSDTRERLNKAGLATSPRKSKRSAPKAAAKKTATRKTSSRKARSKA
jgi:hypothetical protein